MPDVIGWNRVKSLRKSRGLSQAQVAVGARIAIMTLVKIESGLGVEQRTQEKVARYFKCDIEDIFSDGSAEIIGNITRDEYLRKIKQGEGRPIEN